MGSACYKRYHVTHDFHFYSIVMLIQHDMGEDMPYRHSK
jgi:hypothetical protein